MEISEKRFNFNVYMACVRLLYEIDIIGNLRIPYAIPYASYVLSWSMHVPIRTIVIGQNPYPQNIYPEIGAALSYDPSKVKLETVSVRNIAYDLKNYDGTELEDSINCFRDSWMLIDRGILFINETVFDVLSDSKSNVRGIKEMESQLRALQVLISESYFAGIESFTCVGMGIKAEQMISILRSWCPKDLFQMKTMSSRNPAAREVGDRPSHEITMGKAPVSKVLSQIVKEFHNMAGPRMSAADKRKNENKESLRRSAENVSAAADFYTNEVQSFQDRLESARNQNVTSATIDQMQDSLGRLRKAIDGHKNAISAHTISMIMAIESVSSDKSRTENVASNNPSIPSLLPQPISEPVKTRGPRRRVSRQPVDDNSVMQSVEETPEPAIVPSSPAPSITPSRARRRVPRVASYAQSDAPTEYTADMAPVSETTNEMTPAEAVNIKCFANWSNENIPDDTTFYEILNTAADEKTVFNDLVKSVLEYIRSRKSVNVDYDPYDELAEPNSESTKWARENIVSIK